MAKLTSYIEARDLLLRHVQPVGTETVSLSEAARRVLAQDVTALENIPPFDRSPYDGYAFRAEDTAQASSCQPVTLRILEEIPAGSVSHCPVTAGCAVKVLTGAPIPAGADAVIQYELTEFTDNTVTLFAPVQQGSNIVCIGEDVRAGEVLAKAGTRIDPGLAGTLASQNIPAPTVYRIPRIGIISTGNELLDVGEAAQAGKIYDSNRYMLTAALQQLGCDPVILGHADDCAEDICRLICAGLEQCDGLILTGGVSVGDYDLTPAAMEMSGAKILFRGLALKPGMACAYGIKDGKPICGLSGNPASSITNFHAVASPAVKKLSGRSDCLPTEITVRLINGFKKRSPVTRILRGVLDISDGTVGMLVPKEQGNAVLSSTIGCNVMAVIPAGSGPVPAGAELKGFLI